jgi:hypothetical protein
MIESYDTAFIQTPLVDLKFEHVEPIVTQYKELECLMDAYKEEIKDESDKVKESINTLCESVRAIIIYDEPAELNNEKARKVVFACGTSVYIVNSSRIDVAVYDSDARIKSLFKDVDQSFIDWIDSLPIRF